MPARQRTDSAAPPQLDPFSHPVLREYYKDLAALHGSIKFLGLGSTRETTRDVDVDLLFVPPAVSERHLRPEDFTKDHNEAVADTRPLLDALVRHRRLVLLGDPGSGKSTAVNWLVSSLIRQDVPLVRGALGPLIPIPLVLRDLVRVVNFEQVESVEDLLNQWLELPIARALRNHYKLLSDVLASGQAFLLVDGLDEVGNLAQQRTIRRIFLLYIIKARVLVTSRIVGYEEGALEFRKLGGDVEKALSDSRPDLTRTQVEAEVLRFHRSFTVVREHTSFHCLYLAPLDDTHRRRFAEQWYRLYDKSEALLGTTAEKFLHDITASATMGELARNPLLLTLMALIYRAKLRLPDHRHLLFQQVAEAYLDNIPLQRQLNDVPYQLSEKIRILGHVAFGAQCRRSGLKDEHAKKKDGEVLIPEPEMQEWIGEAIARDVRPDEKDAIVQQFIRFLSRNAGLLIPRGKDKDGTELYAFLHLAFQEYFAACWLHTRVNDDIWELQNLDSFSPCSEEMEQSSHPLTHDSMIALRDFREDPRWHEVLLLLCILQTRRRFVIALFAGNPAARPATDEEVTSAFFDDVKAMPEEPEPIDYIYENWKNLSALRTAVSLEPALKVLDRPWRIALIAAAWLSAFRMSVHRVGNSTSSIIPRLLGTPHYAKESREALALALRRETVRHLVVPDVPARPLWEVLTQSGQHKNLTWLTLLSSAAQDGMPAFTEFPALTILVSIYWPVRGFVNQLPLGLKELYLHECQELASADQLPPGLDRLCLGGSPSLTTVDHLPQGLKFLQLSGCPGLTTVDQLPRSLTELSLNFLKHLKAVDHLPKGLKRLSLCGCSRLTSVDHLPVGLEHLDLSGCTSLSMEAVERVKQALPRCDIFGL